MKAEQIEQADRLVKQIYDFFDAPIDDLYVRRGTENIVNARFFSYYLLNLAGLDYAEIADYFHKTHRNVRRGIGIILFGITTQKYYKSRYDALMDKIKAVPKIK